MPGGEVDAGGGHGALPAAAEAGDRVDRHGRGVARAGCGDQRGEQASSGDEGGSAPGGEGYGHSSGQGQVEEWVREEAAASGLFVLAPGVGAGRSRGRAGDAIQVSWFGICGDKRPGYNGSLVDEMAGALDACAARGVAAVPGEV